MYPAVLLPPDTFLKKFFAFFKFPLYKGQWVWYKIISNNNHY